MATGVLPVNSCVLKVNTAGRTAPGTYVQPKDLTDLNITLDDGVEEWNPLDMDGWVRRLKTAKSMSISTEGKRNYGDAGNDYLAGLMLKNGADANSVVEITFPNLDTLSMPCVVNVTDVNGGASTDVAQLNIEFLSDGKPTYTVYVPEP